MLLSSIDAKNVNVATGSKTALKVYVLDLEDKGVHNAKVTIKGSGTSFNTDNKGISPAIEVSSVENYLDPLETEWFCITVLVEKKGYVNTVIVNCVIYTGQTRSLTVRIYSDDGSGLPVVCYVESPPQDYLQKLFDKK